MNEVDIPSRVLPNWKLSKAFAIHLQEIWRLREVEYIKQHGRTAPCACMHYLPGDYAEALRLAQLPPA